MARGHYTFSQMREMTDIEIMFLYHYQELAIKEQQQYLTSILGVVWDKATLVKQMTSGSGDGAKKESLDELFIPLSLAVNPEVLDFVKSQFGMATGSNEGTKSTYIGGGDYVPKKNEVIKPMSELSKEEFMKLLGRKS
jgi:hypothetical protein